MTRYRPTWVEVDLDAIRYNVQLLKPEGVELMAVLKADGYGHGYAPVAEAALEAGAEWLGVALVEEGIALRDTGVDARILVLSEFPRGSEKEALAASLTPTVYTQEGLAAVAEAGSPDPVAVHLKVDTGMHRAGFWPPEDAPGFAREIVRRGLRLEGLYTHFACADEDASGTTKQLRWLLAVADRLRAEGIHPLLHAANSAATILHPETHLDMVRTGAAMYGIDPGGGIGPRFGVRPALTWKSEVSTVRRLPAGERISYGWRYTLERDSNVANVPVGYEDGYSRALSSKAEVLIRGRRHRVAGTVTMDQILVDCGDEDVASGDEVVLIGQQGEERITADELASRIGTIGYEIVTAISERVPREYRG